MREAGTVSLWLGTAPSSDALEEYVGFTYDSDGELLVPQFMYNFDLPRWDEDFREAEFLGDVGATIAEVLSGFSYDTELIPQFEQQLGKSLNFPVNCVVLLYNFNHHTPAVQESTGVVKLKFMGIAKYNS